MCIKKKIIYFYKYSILYILKFLLNNLKYIIIALLASSASMSIVMAQSVGGAGSHGTTGGKGGDGAGSGGGNGGDVSAAAVGAVGTPQGAGGAGANASASDLGGAGGVLGGSGLNYVPGTLSAGAPGANGSAGGGGGAGWFLNVAGNFTLPTASMQSGGKGGIGACNSAGTQCGGGGGGGVGLIVDGAIPGSVLITAPGNYTLVAGGDGAKAVGTGGAGGGGVGIFLKDNARDLRIYNVSINGGDGGKGVDTISGGDGGAALVINSNVQLSIVTDPGVKESGSAARLNGGAGGDAGTGMAGKPGAAMVFQGNNSVVTLTNSIIVSGISGGGTVQAVRMSGDSNSLILEEGAVNSNAFIITASNANEAILLDGDNNSIELRGSILITGYVNSTGKGNALAFGGDANRLWDSHNPIDLSTFGDNKSFRGFDHLVKNGDSTRIIAGVQTTDADWTINNGIIRLAADADISNAKRVTVSSLDPNASDGARIDVDNVTASSVSFKSLAGGDYGRITSTQNAKKIIVTAGLNEVYAGDFVTKGGFEITGGSQIFINPKVYEGNTSIGTGATLQMGDGVTDGYFKNGGKYTSTVTIAQGGTYAINNPTQTIYKDLIKGAGDFHQMNTGKTTFVVSQEYTGKTLITGGILELADSADGLTSGGIASSLLDIGVDNSTQGSFVVNLSKAYTLSSVITGTGSFKQQGAGTTALTGNSLNFSGTTMITNGTLKIGSGGTTGALSGNIRNDTHLAFDRSDAASYSGVLSGAGDLTKLSAGILTLSGSSNAFTGKTTVEGGQLFVSGTLGTVTSGAVSVSSGAQLAGTGTIGGATTVASGGALLGQEGSVLKFQNSLTLTGGSIINASLGQAPNTSGLFNVTGNLSLAGTMNIINLHDFGPGTYRIFDYTGTYSGVGLTIGTVPTGFDASKMVIKTDTANQVNLIFADQSEYNNWDGGDITKHNNNVVDGGDGVWNATNENWVISDGSRNGVWNDGDYALFAGSAGTVSIDDTAGALTSKGLVFSVDGYILKDGHIVLAGGAMPTIRVGDGSASGANMMATISSEIKGTAGLKKIDKGILILTADNTYSGGTTVSGGILQLGDGHNTGSILGNILVDSDDHSYGTLVFNRADDVSINNIISGGGKVVHRGAGVTTLSGNNTFSGGLTVEKGTVKAGIIDNAFGAGKLTVNAGATADLDGFNTKVDGLEGAGSISLSTATLTLHQDADTTFSGVISGAGNLVKEGAGKLTLSGGNNYSGTTTLNAGALYQGAQGGFSSTSAYVISTGSNLYLNDFVTTMASLSNGGTITMGATGSNVLNISGNYTGTGGTIILNAALGGDNSQSDLVKINGDTTGNTNLKVVNRGGAGEKTTDGIKIIDVSGQSDGVFNLLGDFTTKDGRKAVVAGLYAYTLYKNGISTPADGNWYLRSSLANPVNPVNPPDPPHYNPGVPIYEGYMQNMQVLNALPTMKQRVGNRYLNRSYNSDANATNKDQMTNPSAVWGRIEGGYNHFSTNGTTGMKQDISTYIMQAGMDGKFTETESGYLIGGFTTQYGKAIGNISSDHGDGKINTTGWSVGTTLTWYGDNGLYVDGQAQVSWYDSHLNSTTANKTLVDNNNGFGYGLSAELGQQFAVNDNWSFIPQMQLVWSSVEFEAFDDPWGNPVTQRHGNSLHARFAVSAEYNNSWHADNGMMSRTNLYVIANIYQEFLESAKISIVNTDFSNSNDNSWGGVGAGGAYSWADDKYMIYGEGSYNTSLENSYAVKGSLAFKMRW